MVGAENLGGAAWRLFFTKHPELLEEARAGALIHITAQHIKTTTGREARLMAKMDHRENLPTVFVENHLSILPTRRGGYVVGQFEAFSPFIYDPNSPAVFPLPEHIQTITPETITSEAVALNAAYSAGIIQHFVGDDHLLPTISGRGGSGQFVFNIDPHEQSDITEPYSVNVENAQVEIDAGYEGEGVLVLIEAKLNLFENFIMRQLYYPYRTWEQRTRKKVATVFLTYSNGIFTLSEYEWADKHNYSAGQLTRTRNYTLTPPTITGEDVEGLFSTPQRETPPRNVPFPQADALWRVINLCELLNNEPTKRLTIDEIETKYDFVIRQAHYYSRAVAFLGLAVADTGTITLTAKGARIFSLSLRDRQLEIGKLILTHPPFRRVAEALWAGGTKPDRGTVARWVAEYAGLNPTTADRRASTVYAWAAWVAGLSEQ